MNWTPIIVIAGILALKYLPTTVALLRLEFSYYGLDILKIDSDVITARLLLRADNKTNTSLLFESMKADLRINGVSVGLVDNAINVPFPGNSYQVLPIVFEINRSTVGDEIWRIIINKDTNPDFSLIGTCRVNNMTFPLSVNWSVNDLIDLYAGKQ